MSVIADLILDGILATVGDAQLVGYAILLLFMLVFLLMKQPIMAVIALILPLMFQLAVNGWLPLWFKALGLIVAGMILYFLINKLIRG